MTINFEDAINWDAVDKNLDTLLEIFGDKDGS